MGIRTRLVDVCVAVICICAIISIYNSELEQVESKIAAAVNDSLMSASISYLKFQIQNDQPNKPLTAPKSLEQLNFVDQVPELRKSIVEIQFPGKEKPAVAISAQLPANMKGVCKGVNALYVRKEGIHSEPLWGWKTQCYGPKEGTYFAIVITEWAK